MQSIYLDNAATSFPKPAGVSDSMKRYLDCVGATINRSVYGRAQEAGLKRWLCARCSRGCFIFRSLRPMSF